MSKTTKVLGIHHIHFWVSNAKQAASFYVSRFGFQPIAYKPAVSEYQSDWVHHVIKRGKIYFIFSTPIRPREEHAQFLNAHGDGVRDVAFLVENCCSAADTVQAQGGQVVRRPATISDKFGSVKTATVAAYGDVYHSMIEVVDYEGCFMPHYFPVINKDPLMDALEVPLLEDVDHVACNQWELEETAKWYKQVFGFYGDDDVKEVLTSESGLRYQVVTNENQNVKLPINAGIDGQTMPSQINEFLDFNSGPGVQHIAFSTNDIVQAVAALRKRGVEFLRVPHEYYEDLRDRLKDANIEVLENLEDLERLHILVDVDEKGYLLQLFTKHMQDRPTVFIELIQRRNSDGFGKNNFKALFEAVEREQKSRLRDNPSEAFNS